MERKYIIIIVVLIVALGLFATKFYIYNRETIQSTSFEIPKGYTSKVVNSSIELTNKTNKMEINYYDPNKSGNVETAIRSMKNNYKNATFNESSLDVNGKKVRTTTMTMKTGNNSSYVEVRHWFVSGNKVFNIKSDDYSKESNSVAAKIIDSAHTFPLGFLQ